MIRTAFSFLKYFGTFFSPQSFDIIFVVKSSKIPSNASTAKIDSTDNKKRGVMEEKKIIKIIGLLIPN